VNAATTLGAIKSSSEHGSSSSSSASPPPGQASDDEGEVPSEASSTASSPAVVPAKPVSLGMPSLSLLDERGLPRRQLKKTCEACAKSKVKCEGSHPCARCSKRGVDCVFLLEQKRGRRLGPGEDVQTASRPAKKVMTLPARPAFTNLARPPMMLPAAPAPLLSPPQFQHFQQQQLIQQNQKMLMGAPRGPTMAPQFVGGPRFAFPSMLDSTGAVPGMQMAPSPTMVHQFAFPTTVMSTPFSSLAGPVLPGMIPGLHTGGAQMINPGMFFVKPGMPGSSVPVMMSPSLAAGGDVSPMKGLNAVERRILRTLFALFKSNGKGPVKDESLSKWFESRFNTLWANLSGRVSAEDEHQLTSWLFANRIRLDKSLGISSSTRVPCPSFVNTGRAAPRRGTPTGAHLGNIRVLANGQFECSEALTAALGYTAADFELKSWPSGFLPWGTEVLAVLAYDDQDVYGFVRAMAAAVEANKSQTQTGIVKADVERHMSLSSKNGLRLDCTVVGEVLESLTSDGAWLVGVSFDVYLAPPEQVFLPPNVADSVGPWDPTAWMSTLLKWVDAA